MIPLFDAICRMLQTRICHTTCSCFATILIYTISWLFSPECENSSFCGGIMA